MTIIAAEFGKEGEVLSRLLVNINSFPPEFKKQLLEIFGELFALNTYPNPLAESFDPYVDTTVEKLMDNFEEPGMSATAAKIIKMMCGKLELSDHFLTIEFFKVLSGHALNSNFEVSSEALSLMQEILLPKDKKLQEKVCFWIQLNSFKLLSGTQISQNNPSKIGLRVLKSKQSRGNGDLHEPVRRGELPRKERGDVLPPTDPPRQQEQH